MNVIEPCTCVFFSFNGFIFLSVIRNFLAYLTPVYH